MIRIVFIFSFCPVANTWNGNRRDLVGDGGQVLRQVIVKLCRQACTFANAKVGFDTGDLRADNRMLMIHNGYGKRQELLVTLPKPALVSDMQTEKSIACGTKFKITLDIPDTRLLRLDYQ